MRRARLRDVPTLVDVVGVAFTRERRGASRPRDRRARALTTYIGELAAVLAREAYVSARDDVVVHVGRRGGRWSVMTSVITIALVLVWVLVIPATVGAIAAFVVGIDVGILAAGAAFLVTEGLLIGSAIVTYRQQHGGADGPGLREARYRTGLPHTYWLVSTLAAADGAASRAFPAVRSWLPTVIPGGATLVAAAGDPTLRRLYLALGFKPLDGSAWVLFHVNLYAQASSIPE